MIRTRWKDLGGTSGLPGNSRTMDQQRNSPRFDVDGMLGALAKWLRILGFDAAFPRTAPSAGRTFVTMKRMPASLNIVRITTAGRTEQLAQFLQLTGLRPDPDLFLSRCLICNVTVKEVPEDQVRGRVPERIFDVFSDFSECPSCGRVFWEGSHGKRIGKTLERMGNLNRRVDSAKSGDL